MKKMKQYLQQLSLLMQGSSEYQKVEVILYREYVSAEILFHVHKKLYAIYKKLARSIDTYFTGLFLARHRYNLNVV